MTVGRLSLIRAQVFAPLAVLALIAGVVLALTHPPMGAQPSSDRKGQGAVLPPLQQPAGPLTPMAAASRTIQPVKLPVRNHNSRPPGSRPSAILLHGTGSGAPGSGNENFTTLRRWFNSSRQVSAHYAVDRKGTVVQFVADSRRAWHVAAPGWNDISIGIELINDNSGTQPFPRAQMEATRALVQQLGKIHDIPVEFVYRHRDVQPWDRADPAYNFPFAQFKASLTSGGAAASR